MHGFALQILAILQHAHTLMRTHGRLSVPATIAGTREMLKQDCRASDCQGCCIALKVSVCVGIAASRHIPRLACAKLCLPPAQGVSELLQQLVAYRLLPGDISSAQP